MNPTNLHNVLHATPTIIVFENGAFLPQASGTSTENLAITMEIDDDTSQISISLAASSSAKITVLHITRGEKTQAQVKIHYTIGENASLQITEIHCSTNEQNKTTTLETAFSLEKNAQCEYVNIQNLNDETVCNQTITVNQEQNSQCTAHVYQLQGDNLHTSLAVEKNGTQANTSLYGLSYPKHEQRFEIHTLVKHNCSDCETVENFKILAADHGVGVFGGMIYVAPHAVKTLAKQSNKNILLSPNARIFSKPQLEIYADDVSCNHGSSTGQLNEDALWYMQTRGIAPEQARQLLIQAFVREVTDLLPTQELREFVTG